MAVQLHSDLPQFFNDICEVIRAFLGLTPILPVPGLTPGADGFALGLKISHTRTDDHFCVRAELFCARERFEQTVCRVISPDPLLQKRACKRAAKIAVYRAFRGAYPALPWGSLTGIRPTKLARELRLESADVLALLREEFDLSAEKAALTMELLGVQEPMIRGIGERDLCVYIGVPFCPSRCLYCSFASQVKSAQALAEYFEALMKELALCAPMVRDAGYRVRSVYIGGGTPTVLNPEQLRRLLEAIGAYFSAPELTAEAGRPDSIDEKKLDALRAGGVTRISINPQSMNQKTLDRIGRAGTPAEIARAFAQARDAGFPCINADVIAGLPGETAADFSHTLERVSALRPENLTVHTLALKRASRLMDTLDEHPLPDGAETARMTAEGERAARLLGMRPYYLYRQKYMRGNLENIGYALPAKECFYNVAMMEELTSILALGAGGISKRVLLRENRIERAPNPKDIAAYLAQIAPLAERKRKLLAPECEPK